MRKLLLILFFTGLSAVLPAQPPMTNADVIKLAKADMSEDFILNLVDQQGTRLSSDVSSLIEMKNAGVGERVLAAIVRKNRSQEPLNSDSVIRLTRAGFSDNFIMDVIRAQPGKFSTDASRLVELKRAGVSERVLSLMVTDSNVRELPSGTEISIRLIDSIDSERNNPGDQFSGSLADPITLGSDIIVPKGASATVRLVEENQSGKLTGKAELTVQLTSLTFNGRSIPIVTSSVSEYSASRGKRTGETAAVVGVIGAVIGGIAGGGKGAAIGAASGASVGAGSQVFMKGQRVRIPSETLLTFTTQQSVRLQ